MLLEEKRARAKCLADKARRLGFRKVGYLVRDAHGRSVFCENALDDLLERYVGGELQSIEVLLDFARKKVIAREL